MSTAMPPRADLLADVEHRRFVALAFADHDGAGDRQRVERLAHGFDGGVVGGMFVAAADLFGGSNRCGFGHAHRFEREGAIQWPACHAFSLGVQGRLTRPPWESCTGVRDTLSEVAMAFKARSTATLGRFVGNHDNGHGFAMGAAALDHAFDRNARLGQMAGDLRQNARKIQHLEPQVIGR